jgi:molybdenum cofactor cytidylyltransferase
MHRNINDCRRPSPGVSALILAAGSSQRFGEDKRLARVDGDSTLLYKSLAPYLELELDPVVALARRSADDLLADMLAELGVRSIRCSRSAEGMGSTLGEAVKRLSLCESLIVGLGDMPLLKASTLQEMIAQGSVERIVYPTSRGQRGNPVLFGRRFFTALAGLSGERGAAALIRECRDSCYGVEVSDPGIFLDVDTPSMLRALFWNGS